MRTVQALHYILHAEVSSCKRVLVQALTYAIEQSCLNKARIVALDEREAGLRATLNLGHTFGHAIETWQGYGAWSCTAPAVVPAL